MYLSSIRILCLFPRPNQKGRPEIADYQATSVTGREERRIQWDPVLFLRQR